MPQIYISYRPIDSHQKAVQRIVDHFAQHYGEHNVTRSPHPNTLDTTTRQAQVRTHRVLLVIFGRYGLNMVDERGNCLIDDPYDPQHIEISAGLKHRLQIHTLVFDDMVDDLSDHIPEVLSGLTNKPVILHASNATLPETLDTLVTAIGEAKQRAPISKPDLSKMVIQPASKRATPEQSRPQQPATSYRPPQYRQINIHESRNPLMRLMRRIGRQFSGQNSHATQVEENTRPDAGRPRVESYRQMWPTSFLVIAIVVGLSMFVMAMVQSTSPADMRSDFTMTEIGTMGRGAIDVAFSADSDSVAHITAYGDVYHFNWNYMNFPDGVDVGMPLPKQIEYGTKNILVVRDDRQIFVINTRENDGFVEHQYTLSDNSRIIGMSVSQEHPIVVFVENTGEVIRWNYSTGELVAFVTDERLSSQAQVAISDTHEIVALVIGKRLYVLDLNSFNRSLYTETQLSTSFVAIDDWEGVVYGIRLGRLTAVWNIADWSMESIEISSQDTSVDNRYMEDHHFAFNPHNNQLFQHTKTAIHRWQLDEVGYYIGQFNLSYDSTDPIRAFTLSPDGRYLATATLNDTIIWEIDVVE